MENLTGRPPPDPGWPVPESPLSPGGYLATGIYLTIIGSLASMGNLTIIMTVIKSKPLQGKPQVLLLLNVAVADLGISLSGYPYAAISGYTGHWIFGHVGCQSYAFICFFLSMGSMDTLVVISVVRYIVIVKPKYRVFLTNRNMALAIVGCWVYALLFTFPPLVGWSYYTFEPFGTSCSMNWQGRSVADITYMWATILFCYLSHIIVLVYCYGKIAHHAVSRMNLASNGLIRKRLRREIRVSMMCFIMVGCFMTVWTPYALISIIHSFGVHMPAWLLTFPTMFAKSSCMLNPLIYSILNARFRGLICKFWCRCFVSSISPMPFQAQRVMEQRLADPNIFRVELNKEGVYTGHRTTSGGCWADLEERKDPTANHQALISSQTLENTSSICGSSVPLDLSNIPSSSEVVSLDGIGAVAIREVDEGCVGYSLRKQTVRRHPLSSGQQNPESVRSSPTSGSGASTSTETITSGHTSVSHSSRTGKKKQLDSLNPRDLRGVGSRRLSSSFCRFPLGSRHYAGRQRAYYLEQRSDSDTQLQTGTNQYSRHMITELLTDNKNTHKATCDDLFHDICNQNCGEQSEFDGNIGTEMETM